MTNSPGTRIKYLRSLNNMSQEELGSRVGLQRAAINKYEKGSVTNIPIVTIENIAKVFNVSPSFLLGWDERFQGEVSAEVRVIQGVDYFYGKEAVEILEIYTTLNDKGRKRILEYCTDIEEHYHL